MLPVEKWGLDPLFQTYIKATISFLRKCRPLNTEGTFFSLCDLHAFHKVEVVGVVVENLRYHDKTKFLGVAS